MELKLKPGQESFELVDGPLAGRKFAKGMLYPDKEVPPDYRERFESVPDESPKTKVPPALPKGGNE